MVELALEDGQALVGQPALVAPAEQFVALGPDDRARLTTVRRLRRIAPSEASSAALQSSGGRTGVRTRSGLSVLVRAREHRVADPDQGQQRGGRQTRPVGDSARRDDDRHGTEDDQ